VVLICCRYWRWDRGSDSGAKKDRCHIVDTGDTLAKVSRLYNVPVADIVKWNGLSGASRKISLGMKLIVVKGDPNKFTAAEENAEKQKLMIKERDRRIMAMAGVRDPEKEKEEMLKKREMEDIVAIRKETDKGSMNSRMIKALTARDEEFIFTGILDKEVKDNENMWGLTKRIIGTAPKPHSQRGSTKGGGDAVESQVEAIYLESYIPDEVALAEQVNGYYSGFKI